MAGAGYKLFNTGDVLTAAQVNTYLQEQAVMRFANAAARTTALSGVLAEGMMSYLDDTNAVEVYNGSAWVSISADQTPLTTKGDLFTYSTTDARLGVGANGETLVADSSTTTGLRWQSDWNSGKNKIINGAFRWNQRNFTSTTTSGTYGFDRWLLLCANGTVTYSTQAFTPGAAPVAGYEGTNFARIASTGQTATSAFSILAQRIEDTRTIAGQTVVVSFWAKAASGTPKVAVEFEQTFGTGGSPSAAVTQYAGQVTLSTSWARYSVSVAVPSISGKTFGTDNNSFTALYLFTSAGSDFNARTGSLGIQTATIDFWGVQVEAGSVATPFTTATGTLAGELAACFRYFERFGVNAADRGYSGVGHYYTTTDCYVIQNYSRKRVAPTITYSNATHFLANSAGSNRTSTAVASDQITNWSVDYYVTTSATTAGASAVVGMANSAAFIDVSAEL